MTHSFIRYSIVILLFVFGNGKSSSAHSSTTSLAPEHTHYTVVVYDSVHRLPLQLSRVAIHRGATFVAGKITNVLGRADFEDIEIAEYTLTVSIVGYSRVVKNISITNGHLIDTIKMIETEHQDLVVEGDKVIETTSIDTKLGMQVIDAESYHASPNARMVTMLQQNVLGATKAPTGEVHIRGQHAEYSYYVDGIAIPPAAFGGFNEVVDDQVIDRATIQTGALPAEYGGQTAAIIDLQNRVPAGHFRLDAASYVGSYLGRDNIAPSPLMISTSKIRPIASNGQSLSISDHLGDFGFFISGDRQETERRIDAPLPYIYNNHGFDYFTYAKFDYILGENDYLTSNINWSKTITEIPFDPVEEGIKHDQQTTSNSFQTLSYFHTISHESDHESNLFIGGSARQGSLQFSPSTIDPHNFYFLNDTSKGYILSEDRSYSTYAIRSKLNVRLSHELLVTGGFNFSSSNGTGRFDAYDTIGNAGPAVHNTFTGTDFGVFVQSEIHPLEWTRFDIGVRYDQQISPDRPLQSQISPRFRWNIYLDEASTIYLSYGRYFVPTNIEEIRSIASSVSTATIPTLSERDDAYEIGLLHSFDFGLRLKMDVFRKVSNPGVDDQTIGSSSIETAVNIASVKVSGLEAGVSYSATTIPITGYINASIVHAYGSGVISGGFLPIDNAGSGVDLDHDQRLSIVASLSYQPINWFTNITATYGSGLANGNAGYQFKTGVLDFNQGAHTTPSWVVNLSGGYSFNWGGSEIKPSIYINNLFNNVHLLKGAFFSGAAWEDPRNIVLKLEIRV